MVDEDAIKPQINYSDGTYAIFEDIIQDIPVKETNGETIQHEFILKPTPRTILKWSIDQDSPDFIKSGQYAGWYRKRYLKEYCQQLDVSPKTAVWHLHCDWHGKPIDIFKGQITSWIEIMRTKDNEIKILKNLLAKIRYKFRKASKDSMGDLKKTIDDAGATLSGMTIIVPGENKDSNIDNPTD